MHDQDLLCATAVLWGRNGVLTESAQKVDPGEENSAAAPAWNQVWCSTTELPLLPTKSNLVIADVYVFDVDAYDMDICHEDDIWILPFNSFSFNTQ